ncbi:MAG: hypothetical protein ABI439_10330 [Rhodospirillales bacterium]
MRKGWIAGIVALVVVVVAAGVGFYLFSQNNVQAQVEQSVRRLFANPPAPYTKATYDKLDVALASRRLTIDNIVLERSTPPYIIKIDRFEATGIDTDAIQTVFDPDKYKDGAADQTFRKLADTLTLFKVDADSREGGRITVDQLTAKGIQGHQFNVKPEPATISAMSERERTLMALDALRLDSVSYDNFNVSGSKAPSGKVRHLEVTNFSRQGVGAVVVDELDLINPKDDTRTSWKRFELRDIPGDPWFDFVITGKPPTDMMRLIALGGVKIDDLRVVPGKRGGPMVRIASFDMGKVDRKKLERFSLTGFEASGPGGGATIGAIEIKDLEWEQLLGLINQPDRMLKFADASYRVGKFSIRDVGGASMDMIGAKLKEIAFAGYVDHDSGKTESTFTIDSFEIDAQKVKEPSLAMGLKMLGYEKVNLSMDVAGAGDLKAGTATFDKFRIFGPQIGDFNLTLAMSDYVSPPVTKAPPSIDAALAPLLAAKLQKMKISWQDDGLTPRIYKAAGANAGAAPDQIRDKLVMQVKSFGELYKDDPKVSAAIQAIVDYLNKPGSITIDAKPPVPPRFGELGGVLDGKGGGPPDLPEAFRVLGLTVTAN